MNDVTEGRDLAGEMACGGGSEGALVAREGKRFHVVGEIEKSYAGAAAFTTAWNNTR